MEVIIIFLKKLLCNNKKIIYICHNKHLIEEKLRENFILNNIDVYEVNDEFSYKDKDILIFDDVTFISELKDDYLREYINKFDIKKKLIISVNKILKCRSIHEINKDLSLFREPRIVQTKINLNNDMPHVIFEFIKWFLTNNTPVILMTKDENAALNVYKYMNKYKLLSGKISNIYLYKDFDKGNFINDIKDESYIYITTPKDLRLLYEYTYLNKDFIRNFNLILFFACHNEFTYKTLLNLCGIGNYLTNCKNEIILVCNYENIEIIMTKVISRSYNKRLWEIGVRKY